MHSKQVSDNEEKKMLSIEFYAKYKNITQVLQLKKLIDDLEILTFFDTMLSYSIQTICELLFCLFQK
jgi:hypothetical protein